MTTSVRDDLAIDPDSFRAIAALAYKESGLQLVQHKSSMVQSRLRPRLRALGLPDFASYCELITSDQGIHERRHLISALTTNVTHFFRESYHFDQLAAQLEKRLPGLRAGERFRIWSAGCSSGQEAISAAITIQETLPRSEQLNIRILATDIDPQIIIAARQGIYSERAMRGLSDAQIEKYFSRLPDDGNEPRFIVSEQLRSIISYNKLNILAAWPMQCRFDALFCRNVVIYFNAQTQQSLWPRFREVLAPDGLLFLGHSERITDTHSEGFVCVGQTTYQPRKPSSQRTSASSGMDGTQRI